MGGDGGLGQFEIIGLSPPPPARADDMPLGIM